MKDVSSSVSVVPQPPVQNPPPPWAWRPLEGSLSAWAPQMAQPPSCPLQSARPEWAQLVLHLATIQWWTRWTEGGEEVGKFSHTITTSHASKDICPVKPNWGMVRCILTGTEGPGAGVAWVTMVTARLDIAAVDDVAGTSVLLDASEDCSLCWATRAHTQSQITCHTLNDNLKSQHSNW